MPTTTYNFPYPAEAVNKAAFYIEYDGPDLLMYRSPRGTPDPYVDRFVGYSTINWSAVNAANGTPMVGITPAATTPAPTPAPVVGVVTPGGAISNEPIRRREGNDLVLDYATGPDERFVNYYAPAEGTTVESGNVPPNPTGAFLKPVSSDVRVGNDRLVTFTDNTQKILTNFFLPRLPNPNAENNGAYMFGTGTTDPEYMRSVGLWPKKPFLVQDRQDGTDRVAYFSDGSSVRSVGWYSDPSNSGFLVTETGDLPDPGYFGPNTPIDIPVGSVPPIFVGTNVSDTVVAVVPNGVPASEVTLPSNLSQPGSTTFVNSVPTIQSPVPSVAPTPAAQNPVILTATPLVLVLAVAVLFVFKP